MAQPPSSSSLTIDNRRVALPPAQDVDIVAEIRALRAALSGLDFDDQARRKVERDLAAADAEIAAKDPDRDEVGRVLTHALEVATSKTELFAKVIATLKEPVLRITSWLGENWQSLAGWLGP